MIPQRRNNQRVSTKLIALLVSASFTWKVHAQNQEVLTFDAFKLMLNNHPALRVANLSAEKGEQELIKAKGAFDPKISATHQNKFFKATEYYNQTYIGVDVPLRAPLILKSSFENANGIYVSPDETTPNGGLLNAGVALPLGQGLITDKSRTEIRQAEAYQRYSVIEQNRLIQDLRYEAFTQYWEWWMSKKVLDIHSEWVSIAEQRLTDTKNRFLAGDIASVDTLETAIQVQNRKQKYQSAEAKWTKETLNLTSQLWEENELNYIPVESIKNTIPQKEISYDEALVNANVLADRTNNVSSTNPQLQKYTPILEQMKAEERWKKELMKPVVNLQYNVISEATTPSDNMLTMNNYKWGAQISWPIFMRKAKGDLGITRIKIEELELEALQKATIIRNKTLASIRQLELLRLQLANVSSNVNNMQRLLDAEREKFNSGESSVFLINTREQQLFDLRVQETEISAQLKLQEIEILYLLGTL
jgi:outer membrane protein TolC